jgi:ankyrin repeat protein
MTLTVHGYAQECHPRPATVGVDVHCIDLEGTSALAAAAKQGHTAVVRLLLQIWESHWAVPDGSGRTAAWHAAAAGKLPVRQLLSGSLRAEW